MTGADWLLYCSRLRSFRQNHFATLRGAAVHGTTAKAVCGWLLICPPCRRAFTFARAEKCELTWEQLAHRDLDGQFGRHSAEEEVDEWIAFMKLLTKDIQRGNDYAYIDGWVPGTGYCG